MNWAISSFHCNKGPRGNIHFRILTDLPLLLECESCCVQWLVIIYGGEFPITANTEYHCSSDKRSSFINNTDCREKYSEN